MILSLATSNSTKAAATTGIVAAAQNAATGTIIVPQWAYTLIAIAVALIGIFLARLVTIDNENKKLGRRQTWRETGPLTWIAVLIVCPFIWHFAIPIPWASLIGLGTGYSVRVVLRVLGAGAAAAARGAVRQAADALSETPAPDAPPARDVDAALQESLRRLDEID